MAYITKDQVKDKTDKIKSIVKKYGCKVSVSGSNSSTITVRFTEGVIDFWQNYVDTMENNGRVFDKEHIEWAKSKGNLKINHYWLDRHYSGEVLKMLNEVLVVLKEGHYDNSDAMTDYFNCAWYMDIQVGRWDKPYKLLG